MDLMKFYNFLKINCKDYEQFTDSYGNCLESFLILDDLAIFFSFNTDNELLNCWYD